jgi:hypothetical protein
MTAAAATPSRNSRKSQAGRDRWHNGSWRGHWYGWLHGHPRPANWFGHPGVCVAAVLRMTKVEAGKDSVLQMRGEHSQMS